jgi:UDPglucose 6-dehydrogenase
MHVAMIGTGYVGLVSGACFSEFGHDVTCIDKDAAKVADLKAGRIPIYEPGLDRLVQSNADAGRISFSTEIGPAVAKADVVLIAVGTPTRRGDGHADLSYVFGAAEEVADALDGYTVVVTKSTVPVGTGRKVESLIRERRADAEFDVASNPEFLRDGSAIQDFIHPDRVVVGANNERTRHLMRDLYRPLFLNETPVLFTDLETSELIKYSANAFLATKIAFINEIADLCEQVGADVQQVSKGIGLDGRIGRKFLHAGPGYGGSCFPKDTLALLRTAEIANSPLRIVEAAVNANDARKKHMADKITEACGGTVDGKTIAVLGLTFKPNTDDMREAPSLYIIPALQEAGARVRAFDPAGMDEAATLLNGVEFCDDAYQTLEGADVLAIITEWNEFRALDMDRVKQSLNQPVLVDLRNIYAPDDQVQSGFKYYCVGRGGMTPNEE